MLSYDEALARILSQVPVLNAVNVSVGSSLGAVLWEDIAALVDLPPFANSQMDGYACIADDTGGASPELPAALRIAPGESAAGRASAHVLQPGEVLPISTGARLPQGADAIVMIEDTRPGRDAGFVEILAQSAPGQYIRPASEDAKRGETVVPAGAIMTPGAIAMASAAGHSCIQVVRRPRVAIIATGDELAAPGTALAAGQIYESNTFMLAALINQARADCVACETASDSAESLNAAFDKAGQAGADVIVSSGGVSVGGHDLVKDVFAQRGDVDFWRVAVRPGKPFAFGRWDRRFFFGLPGNPASSMVTFELFVRPALRRLAGHSQLVRSVRTATLAEPISHQPGRRSFLRAITRYELGRFLSTPAGSQGSHLIGPLVSANSLIILPEEVACLDAGALVQAMLLREVD